MPANKTELFAWLDSHGARPQQRARVRSLMDSEVVALLAHLADEAALARFFQVDL